MKIAVTGATGFIGRHVLRELARDGADVTAMTRSAPGSVQTPTPCRIVQQDIGDASSDAYERLGRPDVLVHLAWGRLNNYDSLHHFEEELLSHYRFLSSLVRSGLPSLVVSGTCFEYGMQSGPLSEADHTRPSTAYGFAKDALRHELEFLRDKHPFALAWARLFYTYGEGQAPNSLLPQLEQAVARGDRTFDLYGGDQLRDYLPVTSVARYLAMLALHRTDIGVVNICSGTPISVRSLVESWIAERDWDIGVTSPSRRSEHPNARHAPIAFWGNPARLWEFLHQCENMREATQA